MEDVESSPSGISKRRGITAEQISRAVEVGGAKRHELMDICGI